MPRYVILNPEASISRQLTLALKVCTNGILQRLTEYSLVYFGVNCVAAEVITSPMICENALISFGFTATQENLDPRNTPNNTARPAGCYRKTDAPHNGYFNNITDPSLTEPGMNVGGVCAKVGKNRK